MITEKGHLFVVGLPIGHIEDITLRALLTLNQVDIIAAEDTRSFQRFYHQVNKKLQNDFQFKVMSQKSSFKVVSYHKHNEAKATQYLLKLLYDQKSVALVSEAGVPQISDPGYKIISQCYQEDIPVIAIPGVSALTTALSLSPFHSSHHYFIGFPPKKAHKRDKLFQILSHYDCQLIAFEAPHRLLEHIHSAQKWFANRSVCIQKELTKPFESIKIYPSPSCCVLEQKPQGEFVIVYSAPHHQKFSEEKTTEHIHQMIKQNKTSKEIAKQLAPHSILNRSEIYRLVEKLQKT